MKSAREIFSENLRMYLSDSGMDQAELAEKINVSQSAISHWINCNKYPRIDTIERIAAVFNIQKSDLTEDWHRVKNLKEKVRKIPLLGTIAAGLPILAEQNIEEYFSLESNVRADFCLRIKGDSMINAHILDNDIVFIRQQEDLQNGEIGAILIDNQATLKKFYRVDGKIMLQAENPDYQPIFFDHGDIRILGKITATLRSYK